MLLLPIGHFAAVQQTAALLLDTVTVTVKGAYGLRKLRAAYAGSAIRVRRSSDNAEQDIGFTGGGDLDTSGLSSFVGSGSGYISKWYDQSGTGQDVIQTTASKQPAIVVSGTVQRLPNATAMPAMVFAQSATKTLGNAGFVLTGTVYSAAVVGSRTSTASSYARLLSFVGSGQSLDYSNAASVIFALYNGGSFYGWQDGGSKGNASYSATNTGFQLSSVWDNVNNTVKADGTGNSAGANGTLGSPGSLWIGSAGDTTSSNFWDGAMSEVLVTQGTLSSADQATIRSSQKTYYGTP